MCAIVGGSRARVGWCKGGWEDDWRDGKGGRGGKGGDGEEDRGIDGEVVMHYDSWICSGRHSDLLSSSRWRRFLDIE